MGETAQIGGGQKDVVIDDKIYLPRRRFNGRYLFNDWSDGGDTTAVQKLMISTLILYYVLCTMDNDFGHYDW